MEEQLTRTKKTGIRCDPPVLTPWEGKDTALLMMLLKGWKSRTQGKSKILKDLDPVSNSVNKEGEIQSVQFQGLRFSNNQIDTQIPAGGTLAWQKFCRGRYGACNPHGANMWLQKKQVLAVTGKSHNIVFLFELVLIKPQRECCVLHNSP